MLSYIIRESLSRMTYAFKNVKELNKKMVGPVGFEPTTKSLKDSCSTAELRSRYSFTLADIPLTSTSFSKISIVTRSITPILLLAHLSGFYSMMQEKNFRNLLVEPMLLLFR